MNFDDIYNPAKKEQNPKFNENWQNSQLTSDPEEYGMRLSQFAKAFVGNRLYEGQREAATNAHYRLGLIAGMAPSTSRGGSTAIGLGNITDIESEILGHTRDLNRRCPVGPHQHTPSSNPRGTVIYRPSRGGTAPVLINSILAPRDELEFTVRAPFLMPRAPVAPKCDWQQY